MLRPRVRVPKTQRVLAIMGSALAGLGVGCCREQPQPTRPDIIVVVIDTLRADHLPSYGYPRPIAHNIDRIAREGVLFERVIASSSWTKTSMASIVTSRDPDAHGVRRSTDSLPVRLPTLAQVLRAAGYETLGVNTNPWLTPKFRFHAGFDVYENPINTNADSVTERGLHLVSGAQRPFFLYLHYMDVHAPYTPDPRFFDEAPFRTPGGQLMSDEMLEQLYRKQGFAAPGAEHRVRRLYDAEIRATDTALGMLLEGLSARGVLDDAVLVVTSDHGEEFREHGTTEHGWNLYPEVYQVPLVFRAPGMLPQGRRIAAQVRTIDVAPTLLELADVPVPASFEGSSLLPMQNGAVEDRVAIGAIGLHPYLPRRDYVAVVSPDSLYIRERRSGAVEVYDLREDPGALRNLGSDHPAAARLGALVRTDTAPRPAQVEIDAETRAQLEELGYLQSGD